MTREDKSVRQEICHFELSLESEKSIRMLKYTLNLWILRCAQYDKEKIVLYETKQQIKGGFALYLASQKASYKASPKSRQLAKPKPTHKKTPKTTYCLSCNKVFSIVSLVVMVLELAW